MSSFATAPILAEVVDCVFVVDGALFQNCRATVRWVMDNEVLEASCSVGLSVEVGEDRKDEFLAALSGVFDFMDEAPSAVSGDETVADLGHGDGKIENR